MAKMTSPTGRHPHSMKLLSLILLYSIGAKHSNLCFIHLIPEANHVGTARNLTSGSYKSLVLLAIFLSNSRGFSRLPDLEKLKKMSVYNSGTHSAFRDSSKHGSCSQICDLSEQSFPAVTFFFFFNLG